MSTESKTAEPSGAPAAAPAQPAAEPVTKEKILEFRHKRDRESLKKTIEQLEKEESTTPVETEPAPSQAEPEKKPATEPALTATATSESKKFKTKYRGQEVEFDDSDGFLGYKDAENLKKENAHKRLYLAEVEKKEREARELADRLMKDVETYKKQAKEAMDKVVAAQAAKPAATAQPGAEPPAKVERPKPPKKPASKFDPLDEASQADWQKYWDESAEYQVKVDAFLENYKPEVKSEIPQEFMTDYNSLKTKVNEYEQHFSTAKSQKEKDDAEAARTRMWNAKAEFQGSHKDYATVKPLREIDRELVVWSDRLASLNGLAQPSKPYNLQDQDWFNYEKARTELIGKYAAGDPKVVESAGTFVPPDEYKTFIAIMDLETIRKKMIDEGILGPKATLHDAFVKDFDASGRMAETLSAVEKENIKKGATAVTEAIRNVRENTAVTVPPEVGGKIGGAAEEIAKLSDAEKEKILGSSVAELRADPELRRKKALILASLTT